MQEKQESENENSSKFNKENEEKEFLGKKEKKAPSCVNDSLSFTIKSGSAENAMRRASWLSRWLLGLFRRYTASAFPFEWYESKNGLNGYKRSAGLYCDGNLLVTLAWGANHNTVLVMVRGKGASMLCHDTDAFLRIEKLLRGHGGKLTLVHVAVDFFNGEHTVDEVRENYLNDKTAFVARGDGGRKPRQDHAGPWDSPESGAGRTYYVGTTVGGKRLCAYEKGKKEGNSYSPWVRYEIRIGCKNREIPLEILQPEKWLQYWAGAYPFLARLAFVQPIRIKTKAAAPMESLSSVVERSVRFCKVSYGAFIGLLGQALGFEQAVKLLAGEWEQYKGLRAFPDAAAQYLEQFNPLLAGEYRKTRPRSPAGSRVVGRRGHATVDQRSLMRDLSLFVGAAAGGGSL